jgi:hypothetical protein
VTNFAAVSIAWPVRDWTRGHATSQTLTATVSRMFTRKFAAIAALLVPLGLAAPVGSAGAETPPTASGPLAASPTVVSFVPPRVGPLQVAIGPVIIGGQEISPGVNVATPGTSLPPIAFAVGAPPG